MIIEVAAVHFHYYQNGDVSALLPVLRAAPFALTCLSAAFFVFDSACFQPWPLLFRLISMDAARESRKRRTREASEVLRDGSISPPPKRRAAGNNDHAKAHASTAMNAVRGEVPLGSGKGKVERPRSKVVPSPVQLNFIEELPAISNVDTISLGSILGDPMIKECWLFNYLFDMDFIMCGCCCRR